MEQNVRAIGIDLGTTYSCIAQVNEFDKVEVIRNQENTATTPSVVLFDGENVVVGQTAKNVSRSEPENVVELVKRAMGNADWRREIDGVEYRPEEISAFILRKLVNDAEITLGHYSEDAAIKQAVITCPAYFRIPEIEATRQAGEIAGLDVLAVIYEPVAAAIAWGAGKADQPDQRILVYDLGGGTFDATYIDVTGEIVRDVATLGDHELGGRNWDELIVDHLAEQFIQENPAAGDPRDDEQAINSMFVEVENAKKTLSRKSSVKIPVHYNGGSGNFTITREEFDTLTAHLLERTIAITNSLLDHVKNELNYAHPTPDKILLVGGSTFMPQVAERVQQEFDLEPIQFDPDESVAKGAALYAQMLQQTPVPAPSPGPDPVDGSTTTEGDELSNLSDQPTGTRVIQSTSHSFGVVAFMTQPSGEEVEKVSNLISLSTPLPATAEQKFGTHAENQTSADIQIMENPIFGHVAELSESNEIGRAELLLSPNLPKGAPIEITFILDESGTLQATAKDLTGGQVISVNIHIPSRMTSEEIEKAKTRSGLITVE